MEGKRQESWWYGASVGPGGGGREGGKSGDGGRKGESGVGMGVSGVGMGVWRGK